MVSQPAKPALCRSKNRIRKENQGLHTLYSLRIGQESYLIKEII